jgi:hypothetical protein
MQPEHSNGAERNAPRQTDGLPFIPAELDDAGLSPRAFRLYCHIARRGDCWAAIETMGATCGLNPKTVRKALAELKSRKAISVSERAGQTNLICCVATSLWAPHPKNDPTQNLEGVKNGSGASPKTGGHPTQDLGGKGTPFKVHPRSYSLEGGGCAAVAAPPSE